jgi:hypothetical protein
VRQALESKRDEMIAAEREGIYASLEVGVRALEKMQGGRIRQHEREAEVKARAELERRLTVKEREVSRQTTRAGKLRAAGGPG